LRRIVTIAYEDSPVGLTAAAAVGPKLGRRVGWSPELHALGEVGRARLSDIEEWLQRSRWNRADHDGHFTYGDGMGRRRRHQDQTAASLYKRRGSKDSQLR